MIRLAIIDYGSGNVRSVRRALDRAARDRQISIAIDLVSTPEAIASCDRIVLPGVGHFADCAGALRRQDGLIEALEEKVLRKGAPFLGVCVGMQLLADAGLEGERTPGLGWIGGEVARLEPAPPSLPLPHIGWNTLETACPHPVLAGLGPDPHVYFVHSYAMRDVADDRILARSDYGGPFTAAVGSGSILGVQFHPEKSQATGLRVLSSFLEWRP
jgi:glutamine amidotransferase